MKIQAITGNLDLAVSDSITVSDYSNPISPDNFEVNVVDLSYVGIWKYNDNFAGKLDNYNDLKFISKMISDSSKSSVVYVFPQDEEYQYDYFHSSYRKSMRIKDLITSEVYPHEYTACFPVNELYKNVVFEPTKTTLEKLEYASAFRFDNVFEEVITKSDSSNKITTIRSGKGRIYTTLDICSSAEKMLNFVENIFGKDDVSDIPDWVRDYEFGNDSTLKASIESSKKQIAELQQIIDDANNELDQNNKYKSILVSNGETLVKVVFEILEKLLKCDLSGFVDENKEDFRIEKDEIMFIGEIKGINTNVKNGNISQLDVHYQNYLDELEDKQQTKPAKALLIINPFKSKKLDERDPVNESQIELAIRNGSLIIETVTLLKMFELYTTGLLSSEKCIEVLKNKTGLLSIADLVEDK